MYLLQTMGVVYFIVMLPSRIRFTSLRFGKNVGSYFPKRSYLLSDVKTKEVVLENYVSELNGLCPAPLHKITDHAKIICDDLGCVYYENMSDNFKHSDKGMTGKYVEAALFGIMPNTNNQSDLPNGYDIKTTHAKKNKDLYKAKERLTITNCGTKNDYLSFSRITNSSELTDCRHYAKIQRGVLFVFLHEPKNSSCIEPRLWIQNKTLLSVLTYDLDRLPSEEMDILKSDYYSIQKCINDDKISQRNQQYLHIHKHGTKKNPNVCALGFTSKFLTRLIGFFGDKKLVIKGRSLCFRL
jgi:hypothetical protein